MKDRQYGFDFSVVIPIYQVEDYIEETILSVIGQDFGFRDHIQLILVNDGSPDNSREICLRYQQQYPDNIVYVEQENAGVSAARNHGMKFIQGKYVNFLDADDKWASDAFSLIYAFFEKNYEKIDVVSCRMQYFEASDKYHVLSRKFSEKSPERILDVVRSFHHIQLHAASSVVKAEAVEKLRFDNRIRYGEDALFINTLILDKLQYGVLTDAVYLYRKRYNETSAIQSQTSSKSWYFDSPRLFYGELVRISKERLGEIIPYVQYVIFYDLHWRLATPLTDVLSEEEREEYVSFLRQTLTDVISDFVIMNHRYVSLEIRLFALQLKYKDWKNHILYAEQSIYFNNYELVNLLDFTSAVTLTNLEIREGRLKLEAVVRCSVLELLGDYEVYMRVVKGKKLKTRQQPVMTDKYRTLDGEHVRYIHISAVLKLDPAREYIIQPVVRFGEHYLWSSGFRTGKFFPLSSRVENSYTHYGNWYAHLDEKGLAVSYHKKVFREFKSREKLFVKTLQAKERRDLIRIRKKAMRLKIFCRLTGKKIWMISDRTQAAGDNGEAFFRYLCRLKPKKIVPCFVIEDNCRDYQRLQQYGRVIPMNSEKNLVYTLAAHRLITSNGSEFALNPFGKDRKYICDIFRARYVFLQHGITKNDLSEWLSRFNKNFHLFITAAYREQESIINGNYGYKKREVPLTGFARYDALLEQSKKVSTKKQLLILPTWRKMIQNYPIEQGTDNNEYDTAGYRLGFKETEFYRFYHALIHNERLLQAMRRYGYTGLFALHPMMNGQWRDFEGNDCIQIHRGNLNYTQAFCESAILLTDYSSVMFDFAYLRRPAVYTHFDEESFFEGQIYDQGYFNDEKDGFGPVCRDLESTVDALIVIMERGGQLEEQYRDRIDQFFAYDDADNCRRILAAIQK